MNEPGKKTGLGSDGLWGFIRRGILLLCEVQKVWTYILIDFVLVDDDFHFANIENIAKHALEGWLDIAKGVRDAGWA